MKKIETREIEIRYCDFCGQEIDYGSRCGICGKDMCNSAKHAAYAVEIYRYKVGARLAGFGQHICCDCASLTSISDVLDSMIIKESISNGIARKAGVKGKNQ